MSKRPTVLCFSGHDPSGGAGIQADIEAIKAQGCHALSVITCLTRQDTHNIFNISPCSTETIKQHAQTLFEDIEIDAIKIGLIGEAKIALALSEVLSEHPDVPVIFDPVLAAGGGYEFASEQLLDTIKSKLLPLTTVITPNTQETMRLTETSVWNNAAHIFSARGVKYTLITGTHENATAVTNRLFNHNKLLTEHVWGRLPKTYHGSGCTLASSLAANIAKGLSIEDAAYKAQDYTWQSLKNSFQISSGQAIPLR
ncbi:MAG: Hydroxymethylpyrimidine phosphate kinase ThiD (EC [uncultured Thiotrichaceae bacterium]|uniref:hydroxymethylpyrimidine kinase n=1 Tax=uncultured Thiotrichaceae bacterium TaxID=298394 RepID=A0A6S6TRM9_9GAMM|nr:MAG: Hydroxymethylpyrimidine phosphate kinase ThiD (EC [uncultured Thiotrichaceae bacterium]